MKIIPRETEKNNLEIVAAGICALHLHDSHVAIRSKRQFEFKRENFDSVQREIGALKKTKKKKKRGIR